nr:hypothetical protein RU987_pgp038 [Laurencia catarinensis]WMP12542.1 hypothetical protein [Laurencia catarinensis]
MKFKINKKIIPKSDKHSIKLQNYINTIGDIVNKNYLTR